MLRTVIVVSLAVLLGGFLLPGVTIDDPLTALFAGVILIVLNATIKPALKFLTFPINFVTLGLVSLLINAFIIFLVDYFVSGFVVDNILWAIVFSFVVSGITSWLGENDK